MTILFLVGTFACSIAVIGGAIWVDKSFEKVPDVSKFSSEALKRNTVLYYYEFEDRLTRKGEARVLDEKIYGGQNCIPVEYSVIPEDLINAFVSIEDKRFYEHHGVDLWRTLGAGLNYVLHPESSYGGSTITQQVVKNITGHSEYSIRRKIQEMIFASALEERLSKEQILELYLNVINLAHGNYGVGGAARYYFSKSVDELTLTECAALAAITSSPSRLEPVNHAEANRARRNMILGLMLEQGYISEERYRKSITEELELRLDDVEAADGINSWYVDMAIDDIISDLCAEYGYTQEEASELVYRGGLNIYLAIDPDIQQSMEKYYLDDGNFPDADGNDRAESSAIIIDSRTGDILGVVGARGEKNGNRVLSHATQALHATGSVIKPLSVYTPALEKNIISYASVYDDTPFNFDKVDRASGDAIGWPKNASNSYRGLTNINYAVKYSTNTVAVKVLADLGLDASFDFLYGSLGMKSLIPSAILADGTEISDRNYVSLALGQMCYGVTLREITAAYSVLASGGYYNRPRSYFKVTDADGNILLSTVTEPRRVIGSDTACIMTRLLQNVVSSGTARSITLDAFVDCAAKTGTTQNDRDKWTIGYTPYYICGVWYGFNNSADVTEMKRNPAVRIWDGLMTEAHRDYIHGGASAEKFPLDDGVVGAIYCVDSGGLMTEVCGCDPRGDRSQYGYFKVGTQPSSRCNIHVPVRYDSVCGGVAEGRCPIENCNYVGLLRVERSFPINIRVADGQYTCRGVSPGEHSHDPTLPYYSGLYSGGAFSGVSAVERQFNMGCPCDHSETDKEEKDGVRTEDGDMPSEYEGDPFVGMEAPRPFDRE